MGDKTLLTYRWLKLKTAAPAEASECICTIAQLYLEKLSFWLKVDQEALINVEQKLFAIWVG